MIFLIRNCRFELLASPTLFVAPILQELILNRANALALDRVFGIPLDFGHGKGLVKNEGVRELESRRSLSKTLSIVQIGKGNDRDMRVLKNEKIANVRQVLDWVETVCEWPFERVVQGPSPRRLTFFPKAK